MDIGKLLAGKFAAKETAEKSAKEAAAQRVRTELEWKEYNLNALLQLFEPIIKSFNESVHDGARLAVQRKGYDLLFTLGFNTVFLIKVGETHLELSRGGAQGRKTKPLSRNFFFLSYTEKNEMIFSESYHIESAWISGEEFAAHCLQEALHIEE
jgi:hypothetical protein